MNKYESSFMYDNYAVDYWLHLPVLNTFSSIFLIQKLYGLTNSGQSSMWEYSHYFRNNTEQPQTSQS